MEVSTAKPVGATPLGTYLTPAYLAGLALVFIGERVVATMDAARYALTGSGVLLAVAATALRYATRTRAPGARDAAERRAAESRLALFSVLGLVALALYFATTDAGVQALGLRDAEAQTRQRFLGAATVGWIGLATMSVLPLVFGELALGPMRLAERIEGRRVRAATAAGLTVALAIVYAALFTFASGQLEKKADYSYFRTARPGESTMNIAASLTEPVAVTAFFPPLNEVGTEVSGYLDELAKAGPNLRVEVEDRLLVPQLAKDLKVTSDGVVVLKRGDSRESLTIGAELKTAQAKLKSLDGDFQKSLLKLLRAQRTAYLTVGHGELNEAKADAAEGRTAKGLRKLIESQNYLVKDLGLAQGLANDVPADATVVIVAGPSAALLPEEIASLKRYADKGGKLMLLLDPEAKIDLAPLAAVAEVTWDPTLLASDKNFVPRRRNPSDHAVLPTNRYSSHASVSTLSRVGRAPVIFPGVSSLDKAKDTKATVDFAVKSLADAFADKNGSYEYDDGQEKRASLNIAAAVSKPAQGGGDKAAPGAAPNEMRAFVVADADAFSDAALGHDPNVVLFLDALRWLGGEESFSGAIETAEDVRIEHTKEKDVLWFYATIFGVPLGVLGAGLWIARRSRKNAGRRA
jgi:hypothetical protein